MNSSSIHPANHSAQWSIVASAAMILAGILAILAPAITGLLLSILVAWVLIFSGVTHFIYAWHTHTSGAHTESFNGLMHSHGSLWWEILAGVLYVATGIFMLSNPVMALAALTTLLAAYLGIEAVLALVLAFHFRHVKGSGWLLLDTVIKLILAVIIFRTWPQSSTWVIGTLVGFSILFSGCARLVLAMYSHHVSRAFQ